MWAEPPLEKSKKVSKQNPEAENPSGPLAPPAMNINYNLLFFLTENLKLPLTRHNPKAGYLILHDDVTWEDFYVCMKIKACDYLFPNQAIVDDAMFEMTFSIAGHIPIALPLASAADYNHLLTNALKIKKNPTVKVSLNSHTLNLVRESSEPLYMHSIMNIVIGTWEGECTCSCSSGTRKCSPWTCWKEEEK